MLYELWEKYKRFLVAGAILLFLSLSYLLYQFDSFEQAPMPLGTPAYAADASPQVEPQKTESQKSAEQTTEQAPVLYAEIKGQVRNPGMYEILANERVAHLIAKAGGLLPEADGQRVNLAQRVEDGLSLYVPAKGEKLASATPCNPSQASLPDSTVPPAGHSAAGGAVNINTATMAELQSLPGIGATRAEAILAYRQKNGPFSKPEDLKKVTGIGDKTFLQLKEKIRVK
ncbi:helix-hairpin-helix domain-containing protein [Brevibacillus migulae]|uniref:helix-hairpin-helix domain-containing protein n=1 Tax=Brevibacillus migulae TaxID=1644114 RepID=UPI00106ECBE6|nr:helix-hairpin-helix domain-containing protein [Brevibacillus migulae]